MLVSLRNNSRDKHDLNHQFSVANANTFACQELLLGTSARFIQLHRHPGHVPRPCAGGGITNLIAAG